MRQIWYLQHWYSGPLVIQTPKWSRQFWAKYSPIFLIKIITTICYHHCCHPYHHHTHHHPHRHQHCPLLSTVFLLYGVLFYLEEMPSHNMPVQRLKIAVLPLDLPCFGLINRSEEILTTGKFHSKKPDRLFPEDNLEYVSYVTCSTEFFLSGQDSQVLLQYSLDNQGTTAVYVKHLMQLSAQEVFTEFCCHEMFKAYQMKSVLHHIVPAQRNYFACRLNCYL